MILQESGASRGGRELPEEGVHSGHIRRRPTPRQGNPPLLLGCLYICPPVYPSVSPSISICLFYLMSVRPSVLLTVCMSVCLSLSVHLFVRQTDCLSVYLTLCLSSTGPEGQPDVPGRHSPGHCDIPRQQAHTPLQMVGSLHISHHISPSSHWVLTCHYGGLKVTVGANMSLSGSPGQRGCKHVTVAIIRSHWVLTCYYGGHQVTVVTNMSLTGSPCHYGGQKVTRHICTVKVIQ